MKYNQSQIFMLIKWKCNKNWFPAKFPDKITKISKWPFPLISNT